jgi:hypothetical protein
MVTTGDTPPSGGILDQFGDAVFSRRRQQGAPTEEESEAQGCEESGSHDEAAYLPALLLAIKS